MDNGMKTVGAGVLKELFKDILEEFPELGAGAYILDHKVYLLDQVREFS
jgi:hypothetical protein